MTRLRAFLNRQPLSTKVTLMTVAALVLLSALLFAGTRVLMVESARQQGTERLDTNMRVAWSVLQANGLNFNVHEGELRAGDTVLNGNNATADRIKELVGGMATIFMEDLPVATNVMLDDGSRALGSRFEAGPVRDAILVDGKSWRDRSISSAPITSPATIRSVTPTGK